ncbi:pol protein [Lynx pardinus]|uniref:Pol protein n=1 Tax=Lynx pardinus TaxID=191816 RepID=A0A485P614_LYNPA|nr:pol protein [Lynx pardinus]
MQQPFCQVQQCEPGGHKVRHEFLYLPDCPIPLLGRDMLSKLGAQITFEPNGHTSLQLNPSRRKPWSWQLPCQGKKNGDYSVHRPYPVTPQNSGLHSPLAQPQRQTRQYSLPLEARMGIQEHLTKLREAGILTECQLAWNTPLLPVEKPGGGY